ncbi:MAG: hypothetical protein IJZ82_05235 [Lachnospiraceae bacterium]|nr:hypothetical protein [Lachnospiraceae bacterium]
MNGKFKKFLKGFLHALSANIIRLLISIVLTLLLPKLLGVEEYSYWQLYLFYVTYTAYSSLGFCEGIYLKHGGKEYDELEPKLIGSQFWALAIYEIVFCLVGAGCACLFLSGEYKSLILSLALVSSLFDILRYFLQSVLQATNRIQEYAKIVTSERMLFFGFTIVFLLLGVRDFRVLIAAEIGARIISMIYAMVVCRDVVFCKAGYGKAEFGETREIISIGFKLLLANLASQLIIGVVRFMIEQNWGTVVFGKVSLTLSLSNMLVTCISAVSIVLFPVLKNLEKNKLNELYETMRAVLTVPILFVLLFFVPMKVILSAWLPQYADSLKYLAILLPICLYETRYYALINTYQKAYRKENEILLVNGISVAVSVLLSLVTVYAWNNLDLAVVAIVILMVFKSVLSEILLGRYVGVNTFSANVMESVVVAIFIISSMFFPYHYAILTYLITYLIYLWITRKSLKKHVMLAKELVTKR